MKRVQDKGFTLIELIFVLVILAILMAIIVATYPVLTQNLKVRVDRASATNISNAIRSWYVDHNTDPLLKEDLKEFLDTSGIKSKTIKIGELLNIDKYIDSTGNKPASLLNPQRVPEPIQNFFIGILEVGSDVRIVVSVGVDEGIDISSIDPSLPSNTIATYDGYESGIIYVEPKL